MDMNKIVRISIDRLYHHPQNPRKNLGDLTELAESIRVNGILQNLTVVPNDISKTITNFKVVIGNRRLEAAKLAGLTELPCLVKEMTEAEQLKTMLMENIQRNDLTVYEQAQGFQMMLDLGGTVESVAKDTGFSVSTIRRRTKLLELDKDKFKASEERGATLFDYMELDKIEDSDLKNEVLDAIGTKNFESVLDRAKKKEKRKKKLQKIGEALSAFAEGRSDDDGLLVVKTYYDDTKLDSIKPPKDVDSVKYLYVVGDYSAILCRERTAQDDEEKERQSKENERREELRIRRDEAYGRAHQLRRKFVEGYSNAKAKEHFKEIVAVLTRKLAESYGSLVRQHLDFLGFGNYVRTVPTHPEIREKTDKAPERALFLTAYAMFNDGVGSIKTCDYKGHFSENGRATELYEFLALMGYEMSDEEKALMDGSSDLFVKEAEE